MFINIRSFAFSPEIKDAREKVMHRQFAISIPYVIPAAFTLLFPFLRYEQT